jgi:hypothetical protein
MVWSTRWVPSSLCCGAIAAMLLLGCENKAREGTPASPQVVVAIRKEITASNPDALVGVVIAVEPKGRPFAAVSDVPAEQFREGDPMTFIDSNNNQLTHGIVRRIVGNMVHVQWYPPLKDQRAPRVGDLAVRYRPSTAQPIEPVETTTSPPSTMPPPSAMPPPSTMPTTAPQ